MMMTMSRTKTLSFPRSTLTEALEKSKRKYQAKIRRLEQQILLEKKSAAVVLDAEKPQRFKSSIPVTVKANNGVK